MNMAQELTDETTLPQVIAKILPNGGAIREDGVQLRPIGRIPWYVVATVFGEQTGDEVDWDLHEQNRRIWNGWACAKIPPKRRKELAEEMGLPAAELDPLTEEEQTILQNTLHTRIGKRATIPTLDEHINISRSYAPNILVMEKCILPRQALFQQSVFAGGVYFQNAHFTAMCEFSNTTFCEHVTFQNARKSGNSNFLNATFCKQANFESASYQRVAAFSQATFHDYTDFAHTTFRDYAEFEGATFNGHADFPNARFAQPADFENVTFNGSANFKKATFADSAIFSGAAFNTAGTFDRTAFLTEVPRFYKTSLHPGIPITGIDAYWPEITAENAERSVHAYTRLRQLMHEGDKPEEEHFFHRRRMRCLYYLQSGTNKWANRMFGLLSDYGHSIKRPLQGLGLCVIAPVLIYMLYFAETHDQTLPNAFVQGLGVSFSSTFNIFGFLQNTFPNFLSKSPFWIDALSMGQMFLGLVLMFLLALGLRTQFRMR